MKNKNEGQSFNEILLNIVKMMPEKILNAEMDEHLGYEK